jgi:hypothetical protein
MVPNAILLDIELSPVAFRLFVVLLHLSWRPNEEWPGQEGLAAMAQCSERTLRTATSELRTANLVKTQRRGRGLRNVYVLTVPPRSAISAGQERQAEKAADPERKKLPVSPSIQDELQDQGMSPHPKSLIAATWTRLAPPLMPHREAVLQADKTQGAINGALKVYSVDEVVAAIENYAKVLASDEYVWSHRWTLLHFLQRGLDRFVPDADPLGNMPRTRRGAPAADFSEFGGGGY